MNPPRYDGTIHPDEWIKQIRMYCYFKQITEEQEIVKFCKSMIHSTINISDNNNDNNNNNKELEEINTFNSLSNALKSHITFKILKDTCRRRLQILKYVPEIHGGDTAKFISYFNTKCFDAEINDLEEQKKLLFHSFSDDFFRKEFNKQMHNVNSKEVLLKLFNDIVNEYSRLIKYGNFVSLKHVTTGKYLTTDDKRYLTGSRGQIVSVNKVFFFFFFFFLRKFVDFKKILFSFNNKRYLELIIYLKQMLYGKLIIHLEVNLNQIMR
jgi:hypothetical protein